MKASILAHGLMQNLVVTEGKKGKFQVIAGARRLEALKALQSENKLPDDHTVPCQVVTEEHAAEMSLAENTIREAMHPADEFEAYARLHKEGKPAGFIAERFGTTEKHVLQRLKLGKVAPALMALYREEKLTLECLMAYAVTDDHQKQLAAYESLSEWDRKHSHSVRKALTEGTISGNDKLARFVGLEAYEAAGGHSKTDLFGDRVYLEDPDILHRLAGEKLDEAADKLHAEGWNWVEIATERDWGFLNRCQELEPQPIDAPADLVDRKAAIDKDLEVAEHAFNENDGEDEELEASLRQRYEELQEQAEELEEKLATYVAYTPEQMAVSGCYVYVGDGELVISKGLVKPEDKKATAGVMGASGESTRPEKPKGLSEPLKRDLEAYRLGAAQAEIAKHPTIAFDLLVFKVAKNALTTRSPLDGPDVAFSRNFCGNASSDASGFIASQMEPIAKTLPTEWLKAKNEADQFLAFQGLSEYQKQSLLAYCVALTLKPKLGIGRDLTAYDLALAQTGANVADYWRPTKDNYLSRVTKDDLLEIGKKLVGGKSGGQWARNNANSKKGEIAGELHKAFAEPERDGMTPEQVDRVRHWLPEGMAFPAAPEPKAAKAKKSKKAA